MRGIDFRDLVVLLGSGVLACSSSGATAGGNPAQAALTGTAFGEPFAAKDTLLIHPQTWKSAASGSTAILLSDTPNLCEQITAHVTTAPGRLAIIALEQRGADGTIEDLGSGVFLSTGQGDPSSAWGDVFLSRVTASCGFGKLFSDQSSIRVTSVGPKSAPVSLSLDVHFTSGDSLQGNASALASETCDETAVDEYLNRNPTCG